VGVTIKSGGAPAAEKPLFEATDSREQGVAPPMTHNPPAAQMGNGQAGAKVAPSKKQPPAGLPLVFHLDGKTPPTPGWGDMKDAPHDRPILVCCQIPSLPNKWAYYEVQWFQPEGWDRPYWFVAGTQWHALWDAVPKGWREAIGHP
jgi:hypothetical protein